MSDQTPTLDLAGQQSQASKEGKMSGNADAGSINGTRPVLYDINGVSKRFGGADTAVNALNGIDLVVGKGEFLVIVGSSGSGKSTLLQLLGALDRPSAGEVSFEGKDLSRLPDSELALLRQRTLGFIFQQFNLIPTLTAVENVEVALAPTTRSGAERAERARELLGRVGLGERGGHLPSQLSGGEQQRVAIARALANSPEVILADEPTGNLDSSTGKAILDLLYALWQEAGLTVVVITHDEEIARTAPRVLRLADGRVAGESGPRARAIPEGVE
jgi:putative ABC transport system ATP-binding protein